MYNNKNEVIILKIIDIINDITLCLLNQWNILLSSFAIILVAFLRLFCLLNKARNIKKQETRYNISDILSFFVKIIFCTKTKIHNNKTKNKLVKPNFLIKNTSFPRIIKLKKTT